MIIKKLTNITATEPHFAFEKLSHLESPFIMSFHTNDSSGDNPPGKFTFVGASPLIKLKCDSGGVYIEDKLNLLGAKGDINDTNLTDDPFFALDRVLEKLNTISKPGSNPFPFSGGALGYFSYDLKDLIEKDTFKNKKSDSKNTLTTLPLMNLGFYDTILVCDHKKNETYLVSIGIDKSGDTFNSIAELLEGNNSGSLDLAPPYITFGEPYSNMTKDEYLNKISKVKNYIEAGDIYQINISQMFTIPMTSENKNAPYSLYKFLHATRPATFSSFMDFGSFQIISNSPERLMSVKTNGETRTITTEPIKGTIERGSNVIEDNELKVALKANAKECAEHVMIVDLERNDLGKICTPGSVTVTEFQTIATYPNLHHMVSTVEGTLREDITAGDSIREIFPGGSITGAPKVRAMEIIDELEPTGRGLYTGGIGYINLNGDMDISMAIRTAVIKDNNLHIHVGGGIVADSVAEKEFDETILKAKDFTDVIKNINKKTDRETA